MNSKIFKREKKNIFLKINKKILKKKTIKKKYKIETIYLEIRASIGGNESCTFAKEILNMYKKYLEKKKIYNEYIIEKKNNFGIKRCILKIIGKNIFRKLFFENGVHRVQRIPSTDNKNRTHTSTAIVEVYKQEDEKKNNIKRKDIKIETYKSSGAGGQHVNTTNSAVRITHIPTGIKVECQKERSQIENKRIALRLLISKIMKEKQKIEIEKRISERKKKLFDFSSRSSKIRTYNFIKKYIKDHFLNIKIGNIKTVFENGNLDKIFKKNKLIKYI
ncbi:peptide chain release factor-like protein [Candidatus Vidania fulgoroideorum]